MVCLRVPAVGIGRTSYFHYNSHFDVRTGTYRYCLSSHLPQCFACVYFCNLRTGTVRAYVLYCIPYFCNLISLLGYSYVMPHLTCEVAVPVLPPSRHVSVVSDVTDVASGRDSGRSVIHSFQLLIVSSSLVNNLAGESIQNSYFSGQ